MADNDAVAKALELARGGSAKRTPLPPLPKEPLDPGIGAVDSAAANALEIARGAAPITKTYSGLGRNGGPGLEPTTVESNDAPASGKGRITTAMLKGAFDTEVSNHRLLPPDAQKENVRSANAVVGRHVGTYKGRPDDAYDFLLQNGKMKKTDINDEEREVLAKSGYDGAVKYGLSLSPDLEYRGFHSCAKATQGCKGSCLAHSAGQNFSGGGGKDVSTLLGPRLAQYKRSMAYLNDPGGTAVKLYDEISKIASAAKKKGLQPVVRMNVTSDIHPVIFSSLIKAFPHVQFDDYTKLNYDSVAPNHSVTYSSSGITQPKGVNGAPTDIYNSESNWKQSRARLEKGNIVAMPFSDKRVLPKSLFDEETGKLYRVVDGDSHDFRFLNQQPPGSPGVIVGLKNKDKGSKQHLAAVTSGGFMMHYDHEANPTGTIVVPHQERARQKMESDLVSTREGVPDKFRWVHADHMTRSARAYLQDSLVKVKEDKNKYVADTEAARPYARGGAARPTHVNDGLEAMFSYHFPHADEYC